MGLLPAQVRDGRRGADGPETYGVTGPGLSEPGQSDGGDDGEDRVAGGDSATPVEDEDLVSGGHFDGTDRDSAGQYLGAGLPMRDRPLVGAAEA